MRLALSACPELKCNGDLFLDYKARGRARRYKCLECSRVYWPEEVDLRGKTITG